ncbi:MAG: hypothetical protein M1828_003533 [Chrysothrix sp. TS-e1954]|nr:MAG: hypothetical protein M1828_003533 [Chrysothrix sp. TS-e1954]
MSSSTTAAPPSPPTAPPPPFTTLPTLSLHTARSPSLKPTFLRSLRTALLTTGFLYISDTGLPPTLLESLKRHCHVFFEDLPEEKKLGIEMKKVPSFLGYSRLGGEVTAGGRDWREQLDLATPFDVFGGDGVWGEGKVWPEWENLKGPNQWPDESAAAAGGAGGGEGGGGAGLEGFRRDYEEFLHRMGTISREFIGLIAEAIGLEHDAFERFFDGDNQVHKIKLVKYPEMERTEAGERAQGVGPHKDSMLTSFLLQASEQRGLQAQNTRGEWVDCPAVDGTLVVAIGQGLEAITAGVCKSTTHRVLSPLPGEGPRYSIPFFQGVSFDATFESMDVPESVKALMPPQQRKDDVEFTFMKGRWRTLGEATLMNRVKSHTDVAERWYPELLAKLREQQAEEAASKQSASSAPQSSEPRQMDPQRQAVEAH